MTYVYAAAAMAFRCTTAGCKVAEKNQHFTKAGECPMCDKPLAPAESGSEASLALPSSAGATLASPDPAADTSSLVATLPILLALPLHELAHEPSPVLALWAACDAAELTLKLVVMAGVAELTGTGRQLPDALVDELRDYVETPTLGKWLAMGRSVANHTREGSSLPLAETVASLEALLGGKGATTETGLLPLRNRLAHGGPVAKAEATRLLALWKPRVEGWAREALAWLGGVWFIVVDAEGRRVVLALLIDSASGAA